MAQSIKLNNSLYWDADAIHTNIVTVGWTAEASTAGSQNMTQAATLTKGTWLVVGCTPIQTEDVRKLYQLKSTSGTTTISASRIYAAEEGVNDYIPIIDVFQVTSNTATVLLRSASATSVTYTYLDRGGLTFVKLAS